MNVRNIFIVITILTSNVRAWPAAGNIMQILQQRKEFSKFTELVRTTVMHISYQSNAKQTVFAFNDSAYDSMTIQDRHKFESMTSAEKANYVKFCTVYGKTITTNTMVDNSYDKSMASDGNRLFFNRRQRTNYLSGPFGPTAFYVNGAEIIPEYGNIPATNGVVHGLGKVIFPSSSKTAFGYLNNPADPTIRLSRFLDLTNRLHGEYITTIFELNDKDTFVTLLVPDDVAMSKIPPTKLQQLKSNPRELEKVLMTHYIRDKVVFTSYLNKSEEFISAAGQPISFRRPYSSRVDVSSFGVTAEIKRGNITVHNGVLHIVDQLLGFVYKNVREQIQADGRLMDQLISLGSDEIRQTLVQGSGVNVFIPTDSAFNKIRALPWVNLNVNQTLVDLVLRLHIMKPSQQIEISTISGGYDSRQFRQTMHQDDVVTIYSERGETWVQGGNVKARVIRPDIKTTNGIVHIIDSVLGIPYLDMAMLICHDLWLLRTYDLIKSLGMKKYITDRRFTAQTCDFEVYGYPPDYDSGAGYTSSQSSCPTNCMSYPASLSFPCNTAPCNGQQLITCPTQCQQTQYQTMYPCTDRVCTLGSGNDNTGQCPTYCTNPFYQTLSECQKYPCTGSPSGQSVQYDMGYCGSTNAPCSITFFVPNSSTIDSFLSRSEGQRIMKEPLRFQYLFQRLMFNQLIFLHKLPDGFHSFRSLNGETIRLSKTKQRDVRIYFSGTTANVIHMDEEATNGVMHIIDYIPFVNDDLTRDLSGVMNATIFG